MRIVVTGALGHIGSRLIRDLPKRLPVSEMTLIDNLSTQRFCSLFNLPEAPVYRFHQADVLSADLPGLLANADAVIHLAAITDAPASFGRREEVEEVNLAGTVRVSDACSEVGCRLLFPSTTSVYGPHGSVVSEACPEADLRPQSPYAESKLAAERRLEEARRREGLRFVVARFGTIAGAAVGMRFHTAVNKFCWQAVLGEKLTVWETALNQKRPYLELGDAVEGMSFLLREDLFDGETYNFVTANHTVSDIVQAIRVRLPDTEVELVADEIMNQLSYTVSSQKIRDAGFAFRGSIEAAIEETIGLLGALIARHSGRG